MYGVIVNKNDGAGKAGLDGVISPLISLETALISDDSDEHMVFSVTTFIPMSMTKKPATCSVTGNSFLLYLRALL